MRGKVARQPRIGSRLHAVRRADASRPAVDCASVAPGRRARLLAGVVAALAVGLAAAPASWAATAWTGGGTASSMGGSHTLTTQVIRDGTAAPARFQYDFVDPNPASSTESEATGSMFFQTVAGSTGTVNLDWTWTGFHAFFQVRAKLESYVDSGSGPVYTTLVDEGPEDCCAPPSGGFAYSGRTVLSVSAGNTYGFRMTGSNLDTNATLQGVFSLGLTVDKTADTSGGACDIAVAADCSLRDAITIANAAAGSDRITFDIPGIGVQTIAPTSALPDITSPVDIDGTTQPGFVGLPLVEVAGAGSGAGTNGLQLVAGSGGSTIRSLVVNGFANRQISVSGSDGNTIVDSYLGTNAAGDTAVAGGAFATLDIWQDSDANTVDGNVVSGIVRIADANSSGNVVRRSRLGVASGALSSFGSAQPAILITHSPGNTIGGAALPSATSSGAASSTSPVRRPPETSSKATTSGSTPRGQRPLTGQVAGTGISDFRSEREPHRRQAAGAGNVIAGRAAPASSSMAPPRDDHPGQPIGTTADGTAALTNSRPGCSVAAPATATIGGTAAGARNVIAAATGPVAGADGIQLYSSGNTVQGNHIGTDAPGQPIWATATGASSSSAAGTRSAARPPERGTSCPATTRWASC